MPSFDDPLYRAKRNLLALKVNLENDFFDRPITIGFYTSLHLVHAHFAKEEKHCLTHEQTKTFMAPHHPTSPVKVSEEIYITYRKLEDLSRMSRYLFDKNKPDSHKASFVTRHHAALAIGRLNTLVVYFSKKYNWKFEKVTLKNAKAAGELKKSLDYFEIVT